MEKEIAVVRKGEGFGYWFLFSVIFFLSVVWVGLFCHDLEMCYKAGGSSEKQNQEMCCGLRLQGNKQKYPEESFPKAGRRREPWQVFLMAVCLFSYL